MSGQKDLVSTYEERDNNCDTLLPHGQNELIAQEIRYIENIKPLAIMLALPFVVCFPFRLASEENTLLATDIERKRMEFCVVTLLHL